MRANRNYCYESQADRGLPPRCMAGRAGMSTMLTSAACKNPLLRSTRMLGRRTGRCCSRARGARSRHERVARRHRAGSCSRRGRTASRRSHGRRRRQVRRHRSRSVVNSSARLQHQQHAQHTSLQRDGETAEEVLEGGVKRGVVEVLHGTWRKSK